MNILKKFLPFLILLCVLLQPNLSFATPSLLLTPTTDSAQVADMPEGVKIYSPNLELLQKIQQNQVGELKLPINGIDIIFKQKRQRQNKQSVTWEGSNHEGIQVQFTLTANHLYGRVIDNENTFTYASDPATGNIIVKKLDPAKEVLLENDFVLAPNQSSQNQNSPATAADADDGSRIDVMVLYTNGMATAHPGTAIQTRIQFLVDQANLSFNNSSVNTQFNLVHTKMVTYTDDSAGGMSEALNDLTNNAGVFAGLEALRTTHGADQVILLRRFVDEGCGLAWLPSGPSPLYAYGVVHDGSKTDGSGYYCTDLTYAHEIGHNLGLAHDRANSSNPGRYSYSYGYQDPSANFRTVMSYSCSGGCPRVNHFSNPAVMYNGLTTGIDYMATDSADNARTLNLTRIEMAGYRAEIVVPPPTLPVLPIILQYLIIEE